MKPLLIALLLLGIIPPVFGETASRKPENLKLTLAEIADAGTPRQYVFIIGTSVVFKTVEGLEEFLKRRPAGSTLTWDPGCDRFGDEPLLSSETEMKKFKDFCAAHGIKLVIIPAG